MTRVIVSETVTTEVVFDSDDFFDSFADSNDGTVRQQVLDVVEEYGLDYLSDFDWTRTHYDSEGLEVDID